jgi:hypothetical protein
MILIAILAVWMLILAVVVAVCIVAGRGDRGGERGGPAAGLAGVLVVELSDRGGGGVRGPDGQGEPELVVLHGQARDRTLALEAPVGFAAAG